MKAALHRMRLAKWLRLSPHLLPVLALGSALALAQTAPPAENTAHDEAIFGFIQFVRWPLEEQRGEWRVCQPRGGITPGSDLVIKTARGKAVALVPITDRSQVRGCEILDLTSIAPEQARGYLEAARTWPILTLGSGEAFCSAGGVACTRVPGARANGFEINLSAAQQAGLKISAQLLMLGRRREDGGGAP
jgi:hypothetical protein